MSRFAKIACDCCGTIKYSSELTMIAGEEFCPICVDLNAQMPSSTETAQTIGQDTLLPFGEQTAE